MSKRKVLPTAAELEILSILWEREPLTVKEIHQQLKHKKDIGYTTALKLMQNMTSKGLLKRELAGKSHLYSSVYRKEETQRTLLERFVDSAFGGSSASLVMQLLGNSETSDKDLKEIKEIIQQMEQKK